MADEPFTHLEKQSPSRSTGEAEVEALLEVWKVLEALTVSGRRIGQYENLYGETAGKQAISDYMGASLFQRIAKARSIIASILERADPTLSDKLETMAENEEDIGYWQGSQ